MRKPSCWPRSRDPKRSGPWSNDADSAGRPVRGLATADVNGDGKLDVIGGGYWFRQRAGFDLPAHDDRPRRQPLEPPPANWSRAGRPRSFSSPAMPSAA